MAKPLILSSGDSLVGFAHELVVGAADVVELDGAGGVAVAGLLPRENLVDARPSYAVVLGAVVGTPEEAVLGATRTIFAPTSTGFRRVVRSCRRKTISVSNLTQSISLFLNLNIQCLVVIVLCEKTQLFMYLNVKSGLTESIFSLNCYQT